MNGFSFETQLRKLRCSSSSAGDISVDRCRKKSNHSGKKRGYLGMPLGEIFMQPSVEIIDRVCDTKKREKEKELKSFGHNKLSYLSKPCLWGPEGFVVGALG